MKMVVDTSVIISVITHEDHRDKLIRLTRDAFLIAPESLPFEIGNAFSAMIKRNRISLDRAVEAVRSYEKIPVQFCSIDLKKSLEISQQLKIYAYDAYFIECAARNRSPLLSIDEGLINSAKIFGIQTVGV
jgi:predicted nucleic acid-binding protein